MHYSRRKGSASLSRWMTTRLGPRHRRLGPSEVWIVIRDHRFERDYEIASHSDYWDVIGARQPPTVCRPQGVAKEEVQGSILKHFVGRGFLLGFSSVSRGEETEQS